MTFDHPAALVSLAAALVPLGAALHARRHGRSARTAAVVLQCMAIVAGGLAVSGPALLLGRKVQKPYLLLDDRSASTRGQSAEPIPWDRSLPRRDYWFAVGVRPAGAPVDKDAGLRTRAAPALLLAAAGAKDLAGVIVRSDGQFHDDWASAARALGRTGLDVLVLPLESPPPDARIADIGAGLSPDGKAAVRVTVTSNAYQKRKLVVRAGRTGGKVLLEKDLILLPQDAATIRVSDSPAGESASYTARLLPSDAFPENDSALAVLLPRRRRVAVIGDETGRRRAALAASLRVSAVGVAAGDVPGDAAGWIDYAGVLVLDPHGTLLSATKAAALAEYVRGGGGLVLVGSGPRKTPADRDHGVNRVAALISNPYQRRSLRLTVVLDCSGSMAARAAAPSGAGGQVKFDQAAQAVMALKQHLTAADTLRVITFADAPRSIYDSGDRAPSFVRLRDALLAASPAGPTRVARALELATAVRHRDNRKALVLVVSDLAVQPFDPAAMARRFDEADMSLAVVAIAPPGDTEAERSPLETLVAGMEGARLVRRGDLAGLVEVFADFLSGSRGEAERRGRFRPAAAGSVFGLAARALPELDAYILSAPQAGSDVLVRVGADALLARRRVGLGRSVTLALPGVRDNKAWWGSRFARRLPGEAMKWAMRAEIDSRFTGRITRAGRDLHIRIDAHDSSGPMNLLDLTACFGEAGGDGPVRRAPLQQAAPGRYEGAVQVAAAAGSLQVRDASGRTVWQDAVSLRYPRELAAIGADWDSLRRLADLTGGRIVSAREIPSAARRILRRASRELWPVLLGVGLALMLLEWALSHVRPRRR